MVTIATTGLGELAWVSLNYSDAVIKEILLRNQAVHLELYYHQVYVVVPAEDFDDPFVVLSGSLLNWIDVVATDHVVEGAKILVGALRQGDYLEAVLGEDVCHVRGVPTCVRVKPHVEAGEWSHEFQRLNRIYHLLLALNGNGATSRQQGLPQVLPYE